MFRCISQILFHRKNVSLLLIVAFPAVADTGALSVEIVDAVTRRPVDQVSVSVEPRNGDIRSVTTENGTAIINNLPVGFFTVRAAASGYVTAIEPAVRVLERRTGEVRFELAAVTDAVDEIVVVERARKADLFGAVSNTFLTRDELRNAPGSGSDAMRALSGLPGLVSRGDFTSFSVRGHGPKNNLIFVDGFPFQQVVHFEQTLGEEQDIVNGGRYSIFAPNAVSGAEFSPGGWSAEFGGRKASLLQFDIVDGARHRSVVCGLISQDSSSFTRVPAASMPIRRCSYKRVNSTSDDSSTSSARTTSAHRS